MFHQKNITFFSKRKAIKKIYKKTPITWSNHHMAGKAGLEPTTFGFGANFCYRKSFLSSTSYTFI